MSRYTDDIEKASYAQDCVNTGLIGTVAQRTNTDRSRLEQKKIFIELELKKVNDALEMLDKYPELEKFMDVVQAGLKS